MSAITTGEGEEGCVIVEQTASTGSAKYIVVENGILDNGYRMNFATGKLHEIFRFDCNNENPFMLAKCPIFILMYRADLIVFIEVYHKTGISFFIVKSVFIHACVLRLKKKFKKYILCKVFS